MLAMMGGAAIASAVSVPLADAFGSWPASLAFWAPFAAVAAAVCWPVGRRANQHRREQREPGRDRAAAALAVHHRLARRRVYMSLQSWQFYGQLAWIAPFYESHGWTATDAGLLLSVFSATQVVSGVAAPVVAHHLPDRRPMLLASVLAVAVGVAGMLFAPDAAAWVWVGLLGLGLGAGSRWGWCCSRTTRSARRPARGCPPWCSWSPTPSPRPARP